MVVQSKAVFQISYIFIWIRGFCIDPDPNLWLMDPDPELLVSDLWKLQDANKKKILQYFFADYFLTVHLYHSSKIKSHKEVTKQ
jgi:hypothetical protein